MVYNKIKKLCAMALASSMVVTGMPGVNFYANAAETVSNDETEVAADAVSVDGDANISEDEEGVFKVTMDDTGYITADAAEYDPEGEYAANEKTPFSWDNVNTYFVLTDRFSNGDKSNDHSYGRSGTLSTVPESYKDTFSSVAGSYAEAGEKDADKYENRLGTFHGGDLKGLTNYIENGYFDALGTNAIWITAPYEQVHGAVFAGGFKHYAYHGYFALDFTEVDQNMGSPEDLEKFIDTAHEHGIRVIFDVVMNHSGYPDAYTIAEYYGAKSELLTSNWQNSYFGENESNYTWEWDYATKNAAKGALKYDNAWSNSWFSTSWQRMVAGRYSDGYTGAESGDELTYCSTGLPDFKTEDSSGKGLPDILSKKWSKEGQLKEKTAETNAMLSACGYGQIGSASVKQYLVAWLSNWVREYGVDGFRCDTAKHVGIDCWKDLKTQCNKALKEWRQNNPKKPGAQWNDNFWMTGEVYDQKLSMNYGGVDFSQAFDSLINFSFKGNESKSGSALESVFSEYAKYARSSATGDPLSYISSHDKGIGARSANAGTALLLCPGGVQTYYGDESGRQGGGTEQSWRSHMNWSSINKSILSNWQAVGRFRRNHISVGAGEHKKLADSPYTFSRTYKGKATVGENTETAYEDAVVVALPGTSGEYDITVGTVFADGTTVTDEYTGEQYEVSGGKVSGVKTQSGVILLGIPQVTVEKAKVSASVTSGKVSGDTYSDDTITVKISTENMKDAKVTVDGYVPVETENEDGSFEESISLTIGEATAYKETTTVKVTGISTIDDTEVTKEFKYTRSDEPKIGGVEAKGLYLRVKKSDFDKAPQVYIYSGTGDSAKEYTAAWPGDALKEEGDYYVYSNDEITNEVYVIVHSYIASKSDTPDWRSTPDLKDPAPAKGCIELKKGASSGTFESFTMDNPDAVACKVTINYVTDKDDEMKSIYRLGEAGADFTAYAPAKMYYNEKEYNFAGEESKVTGTFEEKEQTVTFTYSETGVVATVPPTPTVEPATPTPTVEPAISTPTPTVTVEPATPTPTVEPATPTPTVKPATPTPTIKVTPTIMPTATAAVTPVPTVSVSTKPAITVLDAEEAFTVSISSVPNEVQYAGANVKFTATATGGSGNYSYQFAVKAANGTAVKTRAYKLTNTFTWKPSGAGTYTIVVNAKDDTKGKTATTEMTFVVKKGVSIKKFVVKAVKKLKYSLSATATGGSGKYKYSFAYTLKGKKKVIKGYSSAKTAIASLKKKGTYKFTVRIKDTKTGTVKSKTITVKVKK